MRKQNMFKHLITGLTALLATTLLYAEETQPKFTIIPSTQTKWVIPVNGVATVIYTVTNQTKITRTLTMKPIPGIIQTTTGAGVCGKTFTLAHGQSCQLKLPLIGSQLSGHIVGGPVICKTNGHSDNGPDPFLCSQASLANRLDITSVGFEKASISIIPRNLKMIVGPLGLPHSSPLTVTNNSYTVTAEGITAHLPQSWTNNASPADNVSQNSTNCTSLPPRHTCQIIITQGNKLYQVENVPVYGSNTTQVFVPMSVINGYAILSVDPSSIILQYGGLPVTVSVTNISTDGSVANDVTAYLPKAFSDVGVTVSPSPIQPPTTCPKINPNNSCVFTFSPPGSGDKAVPSNGGYLPVPIRGSNTSQVAERVKLEFINATIDAEPRSLAFTGDDIIVQSITVKNISSSSSVTPVATDILLTTTANFNASALAGKVEILPSSTCTNVLQQGLTCRFDFKPISGGGPIASTTFDIAGSNTNAIPINISVTDAVLSWTNSSPVQFNKSIVLATQNIFTVSSGAGNNGATVPSLPRVLTLYNVGTIKALNVTIKVQAGSPNLPNGTKLKITNGTYGIQGLPPISCGEIDPNGSCTINIMQGTTPSSPPPAAPVPTTLEISDDFSNTLTADITLLTYGNEYANGYVYWINDIADSSKSITGRVVETSDAGRAPWNNQPNCEEYNPNESCTPVLGTNNNDGFNNTAKIINTLNGTSDSGYAAQLCYDLDASNEWYLPAACELGYDVNTPNASCGSASVPAFQNILSNAPQIAQSYEYWSSMVSDPTGSVQTSWANIIQLPSSSYNQSFLVDETLGVRCAKKFG